MMLFGFTFLRYILYALFLFAGVNLYNSRKTSNRAYWKLVLPIILFYSHNSCMTGTLHLSIRPSLGHFPIK